MELIGKIRKGYKDISSKMIFRLATYLPWAIIVICIAVSMLKKGYIAYESNDDAFLNLITSGSLGHRYAMNIHNNIVLGWGLTVLYSISDAHNWYTIVEYILYFSTLLFFGISNICKNKIVKGYLTNLILLWSTLSSMVCNINYSKTAVFCMMTGLFIVGVSIDNDEYRKPGMRLLQVIGALFAFVGSLFRGDSVVAILPFALLMIVYLALKYGKEFSKRSIIMILMFVLVAIAWIAHTFAYYSDPEWKHYKEYNYARTKLIDYGIPSFYEYQEEYEALGLSETDYQMLKNWSYPDEDVFSVETLEKLVEIRETHQEKLQVQEQLEKLFTGFINDANTYRIVYVLLFVFFTVCINANKKNFGYQLLTLIFSVGEIFGLFWSGRVVERAVYIAAISGIIALLFFADKITRELGRFIEAICFILTGIYTYYGVGYTWIESRFESVVYDKTDADAFGSYINEHKENLYAYDVGIEGYFLMTCNSPLDKPFLWSRENAVIMGGWPIPSPIYGDIIGQYGDRYNLCKTIVENDNAYWIVYGDYHGYTVIQYMEEHYHATPVVVDEFGNYKVVSFVTTP